MHFDLGKGRILFDTVQTDGDTVFEFATESAVLTFKQASRRLNLIILNVIWYKDSGILIYIKEVVQNEKSF